MGKRTKDLPPKDVVSAIKGCFVCSGVIDEAAGDAYLDVGNGSDRDIYRVCLRCGDGLRRHLVSAAKTGIGIRA